jgi:putative hemin transport protein
LLLPKEKHMSGIHPLPPTDPKQLRHGLHLQRQRGVRRQRDVAAALAVSEGELVAAFADCGLAMPQPLRARRLRPAWPSIVDTLQGVGEVMALTRNASCVHEKVGVYRDASVNGHVGLVLGREIDLRIFYDQWAHGFAVDEAQADGRLQRSLQFYDRCGDAVHKVFVRGGTDLRAFDRLLEQFADDAAAPGLRPEPASPAQAQRSDAEIDVDGFRGAWMAMRDTHDFFGLLRRFGVSRTQAMRLAPEGFADAADAGSAQRILSRAAQQAVPIMVFVGNPGVIQIHSGPVQRVEVMGPWLNVLDPGFNLHLREDHIAQAWHVRKPTSDGLVNSLELFDAAGNTIAMLFGERKPGQAERCDWRTLIDDLPVEEAPCAA